MTTAKRSNNRLAELDRRPLIRRAARVAGAMALASTALLVGAAPASAHDCPPEQRHQFVFFGPCVR